MIEINLAHQLQGASTNKKYSNRSLALLVATLSLEMVAVSWWGIQSKQQELEYLNQEKSIQVQSLADSHTTLIQLQRYQDEKVVLSGSLEDLHGRELSKKRPMIVLDGVSRSIEGLDVWLDRVQMVDQVVELRGQSFSLHEIGKYVDALESQQVMISLPVVEILDQQGRDRAKRFSFIIRFNLGRYVTT
jgi:hypothetical protein